MPLSGEEIRARLAEFAARWGGYKGTERAGAQTFLNELLECYGTDLKAEGALFEDPPPGGGGFIDMIWPRVCLVEMKRPSEADKLEAHRKQALDYWQRSGTPQVPAPRYVVLCAFHRFEVWEPGALYTEPRAKFTLAELEDHLDALLFLAGHEPVFVGGHAELTREAVDRVTGMFGRLEERQAADPDALRDFVLQCVWCMFAEDLGMLPSQMFTRVLDGLLREPQRSSADDLGSLFRYLNEPDASKRPQAGVYAAVPYADGGLFAKPTAVHLEKDELELLFEAANGFNWAKVQPAIFGELLQGALGRERQWRFGAHYTAEADILKVVLPTIVDPWRERIAKCKTLKQVEAAQHDLLRYVVLDPACGSGNFLYVAYRHLRRIEAELRRRAADMRRAEGRPEQESLSLFPLANMKGIEIEPFAVKLARVTLWMGHKLARDELDIPEAVLPLVDLSGIRRGDALVLDWPAADAIIGNPPFHGDRYLRRVLGDERVEWLKREFRVGVKDYCVYWFRKAHDHLAPGDRAGLVGTNSISQNRARSASLEYIVENGGVITNAVSTQDWSGEAAVDVSIVNWVKNPVGPLQRTTLDGVEVSGITPSLRSGSDPEPPRLKKNRGIAFQGMLPGANYLVDAKVAKRLRAENEPNYRDVVRPYLTGDDIASDPKQRPSRYIVDFGQRSLEEAMNFPDALQIVRLQAKQDREESTSYGRNPRWWQFLWPRPVFRETQEGLTRFIAGTATGKRILFCWCDLEVVASNAANVFALDDDYSMGLLQSGIHTSWAKARSSTLEDRIRYTPTSAFETFPWPDGSRDDLAELARQLYVRRSEICLDRQIGLTTLYNEVDEGAYQDLQKLHRQLDEGVAAAYGWPKSAAHDPDESNRRLLELNRRIAAGEIDYKPFTSSGS